MPRSESRPTSTLESVLSPQSWLESLQGSGIRPGLTRMRTLLRALGRPERAYRSVIVAGTNGKGSTAATLASILRASGYRTALYTSPHLVALRERWIVDGRWIEEGRLEDAIERLQSAAASTGIVPTYFEALTLIAFIAFAVAQCEIAVLEVGMGGRLDATNVVRPIAALITPIGLDHTEYLGNTLRKVAREKAGVIHRGTIALTSNEDPVVLEVLRRRAASFRDRLIVVRDEHDAPLAGEFQRHNVALAVRAAEELRPLLPGITAASIERGVSSTRWRGRLEHLRLQGKEIWIDGCHNLNAAQAIATFVRRHIASPRMLVFGIMRDKDVRGVADFLFPLFDRVVTTEAYPPRSATAEELAALDPDRSIAEREPRRAFERALGSGYGTIFIGGSLYLAGAAIEYFDAKGHRRDHQQE